MIEKVDFLPAKEDNFVNACDSHIHIFDSRFKETLAADDMAATPATADDYQLIQKRIGTSRVVIVTPRNYDTNNAVTLDAIAKFGVDRSRGVAVLRPDVTDRQLEALHAGGIRGIQFTLYTRENAPTSFDMVESLAHRVHGFGWHLQLHWSPEQIVTHKDLLRRLPTQIVFDHFARVSPKALAHPARGVVARLLENERAWIKLSAPYLDSVLGADAEYADMGSIARYWICIQPERVIWGSDWPQRVALKRNFGMRVFAWFC